MVFVGGGNLHPWALGLPPGAIDGVRDDVVNDVMVDPWRWGQTRPRWVFRRERTVEARIGMSEKPSWIACDLDPWVEVVRGRIKDRHISQAS